MKAAFFLTALAVVLSSCITAPPVIVQYRSGPAQMTDAKGQPVGTQSTPTPGDQKAENTTSVPVPVVSYDTPTDTEDAEPGSPAPTTPQAAVTDQVSKYTVVPMKGRFTGGAVTYNFADHQTYQVFTSLDRVTNIILEPGEEIMGQPVTGDNKNFSLVPGASIQDGQKAPNLFLSPRAPGKKTNLIVLTNRRTYNFELSSYRETYMPTVQFEYPADAIKAQAKAADGAIGDIVINTSVTNLDFNYSISPMSVVKPAWAPSIVFTDGVKTYLQFASAKRASYAPVFFALDDNGKPEILNYRVKGIFYIIDRVVEKGQLVLNRNDGNIISIIRNH